MGGEASATILLVGDDDDSRALVRRGLESVGYRVKTAYDEQEAIERAQCVRPDLILLEMGGPRHFRPWTWDAASAPAPRRAMA